ncbi:alanine racemase [Calidifontibacter sp. DB0510]|uniref:Alanine racemase n=1 Tax=Metallococcus carri TaxID=1656884 RepID=A0A967EAW2_9MICO|nr:alanine racemase [Metallococcus carri]NHN56655.1 alanine racemase [Metallococcus carri]NOP38954.1 alanine racemase [Calidifontibacter sp. DB2511S]
MTALEGGAPARATIDLDAIAHNVARLKEYAGAAEVMAVVKGDAYGHGLVPAGRAALRGGATWLGVAQLSEALALRAAGISAPILSWLHAPGLDFTDAVREGIDLGVPAIWELEAVAAAARTVGRPARVQLKVDTGLARNGAYGKDWPLLLEAAARLDAEEAVRVTGVFTHFAFADAPTHPTVLAQQERFADAVRDCERAGLRLEVRHMSNSAATLTTPAAAWDMVRPGLAVYGLSPVPDLGDSAHFGLVPAMEVSANVTVAKRIPAGQGVSYAHTYVTDKETTVIDIPCGYVDGVPRHASNRGPVVVHGERFTIAGRVCMDQFVVDVGELPVQAGDRVVLFGADAPTAQDWAEAADTISYEIVARMSSRLPRVYKGQA